MSSKSYPHPEKFKTESKPKQDADSCRIEYRFNQLLGKNSDEYVFVDYVFDNLNTNVGGTVGTMMRAVPTAEAERRVQVYKQYHTSPMSNIYDAINPSLSWKEWINARFRRDGYGVIYDRTYEWQYGDVVIEKLSQETHMEASDIACVECVNESRLTRFFDDDNRHTLDTVYDVELLKVANQAEHSSLSNY